MRTLYIEVLATYDGPEPCVGRPRGRRRSVGRGMRRRAIEPRENQFGVPTLSYEAEGNIVQRRFREPVADPAGSENQCMESAGQPAWRKE
jgi:RNA-directed DNA polymerase